MDEDDDIHISFNSPKGKLIKLLETKCKKPEVDNSLLEILDKYRALTEQQKSYLQNGIFNINFAEEALFIQGCALYYSKRVDKLYDELLASHLRLVQYDEKHAKETHNSNKRKKEERILELKKIENRMNKTKRKKITLVEARELDEEQVCGASNVTNFSTSDLEETDLQKEPPFEVDKSIICQWDALEQQQYSPDKVSNIMWEYSCQGYQLENEVIAGEDHPIYDASDPEEYNSKYSRVPSFHHIKQLFQYNDNCLLPDFQEVIAKLRLAFYGTKSFFIRNKISRDTSFEKYNEEFNIFARNFYSDEHKRIQNMPQNTQNQLKYFYNILVKREMEARVSMVKQASKISLKEVSSVTLKNIIQAPLSEIFNMHLEGKLSVISGIFHKGIVKEISGNIMNCGGSVCEEINRNNVLEDSRVPLTQNIEKSGDDTDRDPEMEEVDKNKDNTLSESDPKFRSDSGYFESGFETDTEDNEDHDTINSSVISENLKANSTNTSGISENTSTEISQVGENTTQNASQPDENTTINTNLVGENAAPKPNEICENITPIVVAQSEGENTAINTNGIGEIVAPRATEICENVAPIDSQSETDLNLKEKSSENSEDHVNKSDLENKSCLGETQGIRQDTLISEEVITLRPVRNRLIITSVEFKIPRAPVKRKMVDPNDESSSKQRKLSMRQIEKLQQGVVKPVNEMKWESFFSMNYQAQTGEGIINPVTYDSDSDTEELDSLPVPQEYNSDREGSHVSDHSYCRPDSAVELSCTPDVSGAITGEAIDSENSPGNHLDTLIAQFEAGWDAIIRDHMYTPLIPRSTTVSPVPRPSLPLSNVENSVQEKERREARKRVDDWRNHIQQKLKKLDEHSFDIHEYGSNIINSLDVNQSRSFKDFVSGRTQTDAIRYFITSLHLANTNNIELCGIQPGQLSNDSLELKLLDKERYHERLDEYQAPSEEILREKLSKMRQMKKQNQSLPLPPTSSKPDLIDPGLSQTPNIKKVIWKGKSTPNLYTKSYIKRIRRQSPKEVGDSLHIPDSVPDVVQPSTSSQADENGLQDCSDRRSASSKRLFLQRPSTSSQDSGYDMCTGSFSSDIDELSFMRDLEDLQENSEIQIQSTPRSLKVVLDNNLLV